MTTQIKAAADIRMDEHLPFAKRPENTRRVYKKAWTRFAGWCDANGRNPLPASPETVREFARHAVEEMEQSMSTTRGLLAAIGAMHAESRHPNPATTLPVKLFMRQLKRRLPDTPNPTPEMTSEDLEAIKATLSTPRTYLIGKETKAAAESRARIDLAIILTMRDAMLKASEAAELTWEDVEFLEDGTGSLRVRHADEETTDTVPLSRETAQALRAMDSPGRTARQAKAIFQLSATRMRQRIKDAAREAGLGDRFTGNSIKAGMEHDMWARKSE